MMQSDALFDLTSYTGKPDLAARGISTKAKLSTWVYNDGRTEPDEAKVRSEAALGMTRRQAVVFDVEHWPFDIRKHKLAVVKEGIRKLKQIADWAHDEEPGLAVGFYGLTPIREFWAPVNYALALAQPTHAKAEQWTKEYRAWISANTRLRTLGLTDCVDFVCPSLYLYHDYASPEIGRFNEVYFKYNLAEARKCEKRVYPFLWFKYHESSEGFAGKLAPLDEWQALAPILHAGSDGLMLWSDSRFDHVTKQWIGDPWTPDIDERANLLLDAMTENR